VEDLRPKKFYNAARAWMATELRTPNGVRDILWGYACSTELCIPNGMHPKSVTLTSKSTPNKMSEL